jgi:hypothetical protein
MIERIAAGHSVERDLNSLPAAWWIFATVASLVGLIADLPKRSEQDIVANGCQ